MLSYVDRLPIIFFIGCLILGLAPFVPMPHVLEKLLMLFQGQLSKPVDIFDFFLHGSAAALAILKGGRMLYLKLKPR